MPIDIPQRIYRAACPGCGAPVEFRSAQSTHAVCSYCRSTVLRSGETLARLGQMAELFDDHSPLQLLARGRWGGRSFTLVGRLQYRSARGPWSEWEAACDDGTLGQLREDRGAYVLAFPADFARELPEPRHLRVGATTAVAGKSYTVTFNETATLVSAQGELRRLPAPGQPFAFVELRSPDGEVLDIDHGLAPPTVSRGRAVRLEELHLSGLREDVVRHEHGARHFACPQCGAQVDVQLEGSRSVTCRSCNSLIDLTAVGGALHHALQADPVRPLIPLGSMGRLQTAAWQVVGFQHRLGYEPQDEAREHFGWSEYLLYNRRRGFLFLLDTGAGWRILKPVGAAPAMARDGRSAALRGTRYGLTRAYEAQTYSVAGEFYWPVVRDQRSYRRDFASGRSLLAMEQSPGRVDWYSGVPIAARSVAAAFRLQDAAPLLRAEDEEGARGRRRIPGAGCATVVVLVLVAAVLLALPWVGSRHGAADRAITAAAAAP